MEQMSRAIEQLSEQFKAEHDSKDVDVTSAAFRLRQAAGQIANDAVMYMRDDLRSKALILSKAAAEFCDAYDEACQREED